MTRVLEEIDAMDAQKIADILEGDWTQAREDTAWIEDLRAKFKRLADRRYAAGRHIDYAIVELRE